MSKSPKNMIGATSSAKILDNLSVKYKWIGTGFLTTVEVEKL